MNDKKFRQKREKQKWKKSNNSFDRRVKKNRRKKARRSLQMELSSRVSEEVNAMNIIDLSSDDKTKEETSIIEGKGNIFQQTGVRK